MSTGLDAHVYPPAMNPRPIVTEKELSECDREKLHLIGSIQGGSGHVLFISFPGGVLVAADEKVRDIPFISKRSGSSLDASHNSIASVSVASTDGSQQQQRDDDTADNVEELLGDKLHCWIPYDLCQDIIKTVNSMEKAQSHRHFHFYTNKKRPYAISVSTTTFDYSVIAMEIELLDTNETTDSFFNTVTQLGRVMEFYANEMIVRSACDAVFNLLGHYDRGMVYRFLDDNSGEVIHEIKNSHIKSSYLGLRFPASDIPLSARRLYIKNGLRYILGVDVDAVPIVSYNDGSEMDLSQVRMRAVSKPHIVYLKNMGVTCSLSMGIVVDGELWGLLAFHGYEKGGFKPSLHQRIACETILSMVNVRVEALTKKVQSARIIRLGEMLMNLRQEQSVVHNLYDLGDQVLEVLDADILVAHIQDPRSEDQGDCICLGDTSLKPTEQFWAKLSTHSHRDLVILSTRDALDSKGLTVDICPACGIVFFQEGRTQIMIGRNYRSKDTVWGGDPDAPKLRIGGILNPRSSFEKFMEKARKESKSWSLQDVNVISVFRDRICDHSRAWMMRLLQGDIENTNSKYMNAMTRARDNYEFFAHMSHELRTPFHGVMGCLSILKDNREEMSSDEVNDLLSTAISSGNHMINLLNDILDMTKNKYLSHVEVKNKVIYQSLAFESVDGMKSLAKSKEVNLRCEVTPKLDDDKVVITTDRKKVIQIVTNTVNNAIKFAGNVGVVVKFYLEDTVQGAVDHWARDAVKHAGCVFSRKEGDMMKDVESVRLQFLQVPNSANTKWLCLSVEDDGCGMKPDVLAEMFAPYTQASRGSNRRVQGTGLGLFICVSICQQLSGYIGCASTPKKGTVFHIAIPVGFVEVRKSSDMSDAGSIRSCSPNAPVVHDQEIPISGPVMIVDDNLVNLKILKRTLEMHFRQNDVSLEIVMASGGEDGINLYKESRPSLCIIDYHMPDIDGIEVTKTIRMYEAEHLIYPSHILFYTADGTDEAEKLISECGADAIMSKPPTPGFLENLVQRLKPMESDEPPLKTI